jgi:hypothetical protein
MVNVNARQARAHAEALGRRAKTGRVDAAMLARPGALLAPLVRPLIGAVPDQMKEPHAARRALIKDRVAARNRQKNLAIAPRKRQAASNKSARNSPPSTPNATGSSKPVPASRRASKAASAFQASVPPPLSPG